MVDDIGILDPEGIMLNPLTNTEYSDQYKTLAQIWSKLPAYERAKEIIEDIKNNQVILIESSTGSGKTVLLPKYALHVLDYKGRVAVTLPKQILTGESASYAANTLDVTLGNEVGFKYKGSDPKMSSKNNKILYATDGTIVMKLINNIMLPDFDIVIIDEAHERKVQIDFLLYLLKLTLEKRPEFKIIIMSATINVDLFAKYYEKFKFKALNIGGKQNYPIKSIWGKANDYDQALSNAFTSLVEILNTDKLDEKTAHDIILFVISQNDTRKVCQDLSKHINTNCEIKSKKQICNDKTYCVELYSGVDKTQESLAKHKTDYKQKGFDRKLIITTPVAESSLTVDGLKYVIDTGYEFFSSYDPITRAKKLDKKLITQAQAKQRMGRSGRTEPGICYHMYSKNDFDNVMDKYPKPSIQISDITAECLKFLNFDNVQTLDNLLNVLTQLIEPPQEAYIKNSIKILTEYGLVENNSISPLGKFITNFNDVNQGVSLCYAFVYNCLEEVITLFNILDVIKNNISNLFVSLSYYNNNINKDKNKRINNNKFNEEIKKIKKKFKDTSGDHISILNIYNDFVKYYYENQNDSDKVKKYCDKNRLNMNRLLKIMIFNEKMINRQKEIFSNFDPLIIEKNDTVLLQDLNDRILESIYRGYFTNVGFLDGKNYRLHISRKITTNIGKESFIDKKPYKIMYTELYIANNMSNLNIVSIIE